MKNNSRSLLLRSIFWLSCLTAFVVLRAHAEDQASLNQFANMFERERNIEDSIRKFKNLEELRGKAQVSLEALMKRSPRNTEVETRYAELLLQRARDLEQLSLEFLASGNKEEAKKVKALSKNLAESGLRFHARILSREPQHPLAPKIYLAMGRTELALGNKNKALADADRGIVSHSKHPVEGDTLLHLWILRGDVSFDLMKLDLAFESYNRAQKLSKEGSLEAAYVLYRQSWVYFNRKEPVKALALLDRLVEITKDKFALRQESIQDYGRFSADLSPKDFAARGGIEGIFKHIRDLSSTENEALTATELMGATIAKNGRREIAVKTYEFLIDRNPLAIENLERALTVVELSAKFADKSRLADRYIWLLKEFGPGSRWFVSHKLSAELQQSAASRIDEALRVYAISLHKESTLEKLPSLKKKTEAVALRLYEAHLEAFPDVPQIHYYAAELYREHGRWAEAGTQYDAYLRLISLVRKDQLSPADVKNRNEAGTGSVEVWAKAVEKDKKHANSFVTSVDAFVQYFPTHPRAAQTLMAAAKIELNAGRGSTALVRLSDLVKRYPKTNYAAEAVHASLDLLNKEGDLTNLTLKAREWLATINNWAPATHKAKLQGELAVIVTKSEAKSCDVMAKEKGKEIEAALCLRSYVKTFPRDPLVAKMLLLAADLMEKARDNNGSLNALEEIIRVAPRSEQAVSALSRLTVNFEKTFQFDRAASAYEGLVARTQNAADKERFLRRLCAILAGLGQESRLNAVLARKDVPASLRNEFTRRIHNEQFALVRSEESALGYRNGRLASVPAAEALQALNRRRDLSIEEKVEIARIRGAAAFSAGKVAEAQKIWSAGRKIFAKASRSQNIWDAGARLRLQELSLLEKRFESLNVKKQLKAKVAALQQLDAAFGEVLKLNSPSTALAAIGKSAKLYLNLAQELRRNNAPQAQVQSFQLRAQEISQVMAQKAREWKVIHPVVISALKASKSSGSNFLWEDLPRWLDLSDEQKDWSEWSWKYSSLEEAVRQSDKADEAKRAAMVLLVRRNSLRDPLISAWIPSLLDRAGIQARVQASLGDGRLSLASLYLTQYESLFGSDAFVEHHLGRIDWARGNYSGAYNRWVKSRHQKDFRVAYWTQGWLALSDSFASQAASRARKAITFEKLSDLAASNWQRHFLGNLCVIGAMECRGDYAENNLLRVLDSRTDDLYRFEFSDGRSGWQAKRSAYLFIVQNAIQDARSKEDLNVARTALSDFGSLRKYALHPEQMEQEIQVWERKLEQKQNDLEIAVTDKKKVVAGVGARR